MSSGSIRHLPAAVAALALLRRHFFLAARQRRPDQDDKFFELLGQKEIPAVDNATSLIETGHKVCSKLDGGMSVDDIVETIRNNGFNENPITRLYPHGRITATIDQFISRRWRPIVRTTRQYRFDIGVYRVRLARRRVVLASLTEALPAGEIPPTKPLPVPAQPPRLLRHRSWRRPRSNHRRRRGMFSRHRNDSNKSSRRPRKHHRRNRHRRKNSRRLLPLLLSPAVETAAPQHQRARRRLHQRRRATSGSRPDYDVNAHGPASRGSGADCGQHGLIGNLLRRPS